MSRLPTRGSSRPPRTDHVVVREYFFPRGTPVPEVMHELMDLTTQEVRELADQIRAQEAS